MSDFYADLMLAVGGPCRRVIVPTPAPALARGPTAEEYRALVARQAVPVAPVYRPPAQAVIEDVCLKHGLEKPELLGPRRHRPLVVARNEAAYRLRTEFGLSLPRIGRILGNRDHTTVRHALARHAETLGAGGQS